ncbi:MAG: hypothetical protein ACLQBC_05905 [Syntrophales bacterium]
MASTSAQKQAAIDAGLSYLMSQQNPVDGSWNGDGYFAATSAAALLAFTEQFYKPMGWDGHNYSAVVSKGLSYLLTQASPFSFDGGNRWGFGNNSSGIQLANNCEET